MPKIYLEQEYPQGSAAWHALRLGIPTASRCSDLVTPVKGDLSKSRFKYAYQLVAERVLREPLATDIGHLPWIIEGKEKEAEAAQMYAEITGAELVKVGFVAADHGRWGCSPDRLITNTGRGAVEIKAPTEVVQIGYLLGGPGDDYRPQCQMQILVCDLEWVDFFAHNPRMPPVQMRYQPDGGYIKKIEDALSTFADELDDMEKRVRAMGYFAPAAKLEDDAERLANMLIADIDRMRGLQDILDREGDDAFRAALGTMPREQQQRVREAIEANKNLLRAEAL